MEEITNYIFEAGMLKRIARSGWWTEGIKNPETVAEHSWRAALIGFVLAKMEGLTDAEAQRVCSALVFHDLHETRLLDLNKLTERYIENKKDLEKKIESEQVQKLPKEINSSILSLLELSEKEKQILYDADVLECAFTAKEYSETGYPNVAKWLDNQIKRIKTSSAKKMLEQIKKQSFREWMSGLKKL
ncbi:HD domain-containing protein [Candidatus Micrarchaeota archaeon]|nr:HD domain-containing protein [Candidatus Micrarchaeota archaeon]